MARPEISGPVVEIREVILPAGEITCTTPSDALSVVIKYDMVNCG